uniref:Secreted protein n=1 Tax=Syphacia muris TaxID=451379 RepID=A0A0N5ANC4_9BILA
MKFDIYEQTDISSKDVRSVFSFCSLFFFVPFNALLTAAAAADADADATVARAAARAPPDVICCQIAELIAYVSAVSFT